MHGIGMYMYCIHCRVGNWLFCSFILCCFAQNRSNYCKERQWAIHSQKRFWPFPPLFIPSANHYRCSSLSRSFFKSDHERMAQFALNKEPCERFAKKTVKCTFALSLTKTSDSLNKTMCEFPTLIHWDNISLNWMCLFLYIITRILYPKTEG